MKKINSKNIKIAFEIAKRSLRNCYLENGIIAGKQHFSDYWARDSFFASFGALELKDFEIVRKNIELFFNYQRADGQIPLRISIGQSVITKLIEDAFGISKTKNRKLFPTYYNDKDIIFKKAKSVDPNSLLVIVCLKYYNKTKDREFLLKNYDKIRKSIQWYNFCNKNKFGFIIENNYCSWADSIKKQGFVLYSNLLYYKALKDFSKINILLNKKQEAKEYYKKAINLKKQINKEFWNEEKEFYSDFLPAGKNYFSTEGNLLAIIFDVADDRKSRKIIDYIDKNKINYPVPSKTNHPEYPEELVFWANRLIGMKGYHNFEHAWLWIGCLDFLARNKIKDEKAEKIMNKIINKLIEFDEVYEVYDNKGKPVFTDYYKSEHPFAWSSGMIVYTLCKARVLKKL
ncbi:MAG: amylo-alpha-1,6-glucosidase [Candidatus Woesearchaeota archaeon]